MLLTTTLGLSRDDHVRDIKAPENDPEPENARAVKISMFDSSLGHIMSIIAKHNFTVLDGLPIRIELQPMSSYAEMQQLFVELASPVDLKSVYDHFSQFGFVAGVFKRETKGAPTSNCVQYQIYFTTKHSLFNARTAIQRGKQIDNIDIKFVLMKNAQPHMKDYWVPPVVKGNVIAVPTNVASHASARVTKPVTYEETRSLASKAPLSKSAAVAPEPPARLAKTKEDTPAHQRAIRFQAQVCPESIWQPGEIRPGVSHIMRYPDSYSYNSSSSFYRDWCKTAFVTYETFHNISAKISQGKLSISTMTWGSQLDIYTCRLHYGSQFLDSSGEKRIQGMFTSLTVEMRQYGDRESASEVLAIRHNGKIANMTSAISEGVSIYSRNILAMNLRPSRDVQGRLWMDCKGMEVCSVDQCGTISKWDLTKSVETVTESVDVDSSVTIDNVHWFNACSISIHPTDSTVLTTSDRYGQVARWDTRAGEAVQSSLACLKGRDYDDNNRQMSHRKRINAVDSLIGCEWNPHNPHEFMTTSPASVRVWDVRNMKDDVSSGKIYGWLRLVPDVVAH
ncbi:hypothetical protein BG004_003740 [Podila humilis]|nr:hypothetical protein BG004_003740 [Podila humilis]